MLTVKFQLGALVAGAIHKLKPVWSCRLQYWLYSMSFLGFHVVRFYFRVIQDHDLQVQDHYVSQNVDLGVFCGPPSAILRLRGEILLAIGSMLNPFSYTEYPCPVLSTLLYIIQYWLLVLQLCHPPPKYFLHISIYFVSTHGYPL